jgi:O-antigen ligase
LLGLYLTYTRGAWLGFLVALPFFFFKKNLKIFMTVFLSLAILGVGAFIFAGDKLNRPKSDQERISQWKAATMAFVERPILGYGFLNFERHSIEIKKRYDFGELRFGGHAHNNFFEMLGSTGILGFTAFILWTLFWFIEMYKRNDVIGNLTLPFIVAFTVGGLTQSTISLGINLFFVMAVYAISQTKKDLLIS